MVSAFMSKRLYVIGLIFAILFQNGIVCLANAHVATAQDSSGNVVVPHVHLGGHGHHHHDGHGHHHHHGHGHHHHHGHDHELPSDQHPENESQPTNNDSVLVIQFDSELPQNSGSGNLKHIRSFDQVVDCSASNVVQSQRAFRTGLLLRGDLPPPDALYLQICALLI